MEAKEKLEKHVETQKKMVKRSRQESAFAFERGRGRKLKKLYSNFRLCSFSNGRFFFRGPVNLIKKTNKPVGD